MAGHLRTAAVAILVALVVTATGASAAVVFSPDSLYFGEIPTTVTDSLSYTVTNTGPDSVILSRSLLVGNPSFYAVSVHSDTVCLAPGESRLEMLRITPRVPYCSINSMVFYTIDGPIRSNCGLRYVFYSVKGSLFWTPSQLPRSLYEATLVVRGERVAAIQEAQVRVSPAGNGVSARVMSSSAEEARIGVSVGRNVDPGFCALVFEKDGQALDSLYLLLERSNPAIDPAVGRLSFGPQKSLDTLLVHGLDFWPGCTFRFPASNLTVVSTELFSDTLASLVVRLDSSMDQDYAELRAVNPDSGRTDLSVRVWLTDDALPLEPEGGSPGVQLPRAFSLGANYPNPFNPSTTISYSVAEGAPVRVRLRVYNLRGQAVATLVDRVTAPGQYTVNWDGVGTSGEKLSSGVYFYRMSAGEFNFTRKMVLLK